MEDVNRIDVSVIIVNYNTCKLLKDCLDSIYLYTTGLNFEIIVVDNASKDESSNMLKEQFPGVILLESNENLGFGRANNLGFELAKGDYIFLLNSDTILLNNAILMFYEYGQKHKTDKKIGVLGSKLLDLNQMPNVSWGNFPTLKSDYIYFRDKILEKLGQTNKHQIISEVDSFEVDYVIGADMFIPKETIQAVGYFDPKFFMYYEETDLQKRMANLSFKRLIIEGPKIIHLEGASFTSKSKLSYGRFVLNITSFFIYLNKHFKGINKIIYKIVSLFIRLTLVFDKRYSLVEKWAGVKLLIKLTFRSEN